MPVPGWPWELVLIALDVWEGCFVLRGTSAFDLEDPFRSPGSWGITTNSDTTHTSHGGGAHGADPTQWHVTFVPSLPDSATEIRVFAGPPVTRPAPRPPLPNEPRVFVGPPVTKPAPAPPLPNEPTLVARLSAWPTAPRRVPVRVEPAAPSSEPAILDRRPGVDRRAVQPDAVIPISGRLDDVVGREVCILSVETWPTCFDLHLGGSGWLHLVAPSLGRLRYAAEDNLGGRYRGWSWGGSSGMVWCADLSFVPTLDRAATALTLELPSLVNEGLDQDNVLRTTIDVWAAEVG
jgi:hypothetical protein